MMRLIDADALKEIYTRNFDYKNCIYDGATVVGNVDEAPTVDAIPVRNGKWKWLSCTYDRVPKEKEYECSKCHHKTIVHGDDMPWEKYCPNCGAKMDGREEE